MSKFLAKIKNIRSCENLHIVKFICGKYTLSMMSLELSKEIKIDTNVSLSVKPSNIAIAKNINGEISYSNQIQAKILSCEVGKLLTSVIAVFENIQIESIITSDSALKMDLKKDDDIVLLIKASELSIKEVYCD